MFFVKFSTKLSHYLELFSIFRQSITMVNILILLRAAGLFITPLGCFLSAVALEEVSRTLSESDRGKLSYNSHDCIISVVLPL